VRRIATIAVGTAALAICLLLAGEAFAQSAEPPNPSNPAPPPVEGAAPGEDSDGAGDPPADAPPEFRPTESVPPGSSVSFPVDI